MEEGKGILKAVGMKRLLGSPDNLPLPQQLHDAHRQWRRDVLSAGQGRGPTFTLGVAGKLINIHLKASFVCGGYHTDVRVRVLHPPLDRGLLKELSAKDVGGLVNSWNEATRIGWSNFDSAQYETVMGHIQDALRDAPL